MAGHGLQRKEENFSSGKNSMFNSGVDKVHVSDHTPSPIPKIIFAMFVNTSVTGPTIFANFYALSQIAF